MTPITWRRVVISTMVAAMCAVSIAASAQSLGDVARRSAERRKEQPKAGKVYTNDNLKADITPSVPVPAAAPAAAPDAPPPADAPVDAPAAAGGTGNVSDAREARSDEAAWRGKMTAAREALERSESFAGALQSQINALTVDFVNRDDPAQRSQIEQRRTKAVAELERAQRDIQANRKAITAIEDEARKAGVPAGWLR